MKIFAFFGVLVATTVVGVVSSIVTTYIVRDIASLYDLKIVLQYSFWQTYAVMALIGIVIYRSVKDKKDKEDKDIQTIVDKFYKMLNQTFTKYIALMLFWGIVHIVHAIYGH